MYLDGGNFPRVDLAIVLWYVTCYVRVSSTPVILCFFKLEAKTAPSAGFHLAKVFGVRFLFFPWRYERC